MADKNTESLAVGWVDAGTCESLFCYSMTQLIMHLIKDGFDVRDCRLQRGAYIHQNRELLLRKWCEDKASDWLLWLDNDIVVTRAAFRQLWDSADAETAPVVSGVYYWPGTPSIFSIPPPIPIAFNKTEKSIFEYLPHTHPLPEYRLTDVDYAGFGFLLMHRSAVERMLAALPDTGLFKDRTTGVAYKGEDMAFCDNMKEAGVPLKAHTGAIVQHIKKFHMGPEYYRLYWELYYQQMPQGATEPGSCQP